MGKHSAPRRETRGLLRGEPPTRPDIPVYREPRRGKPKWVRVTLRVILVIFLIFLAMAVIGNFIPDQGTGAGSHAAGITRPAVSVMLNGRPAPPSLAR